MKEIPLAALSPRLWVVLSLRVALLAVISMANVSLMAANEATLPTTQSENIRRESLIHSRQCVLKEPSTGQTFGPFTLSDLALKVRVIDGLDFGLFAVDRSTFKAKRFVNGVGQVFGPFTFANGVTLIVGERSFKLYVAGQSPDTSSVQGISVSKAGCREFVLKEPNADVWYGPYEMSDGVSLEADGKFVKDATASFVYVSKQDFKQRPPTITQGTIKDAGKGQYNVKVFANGVGYTYGPFAFSNGAAITVNRETLLVQMDGIEKISDRLKTEKQAYRARMAQAAAERKSIAEAIQNASAAKNDVDAHKILSDAIAEHPFAQNIADAKALLAQKETAADEYRRNTARGLVMWRGKWCTPEYAADFENKFGPIFAENERRRAEESSQKAASFLSVLGGHVHFRTLQEAWAYANSLSAQNVGAVDDMRERSINGGGTVIGSSTLLQRYKPVPDRLHSGYWTVRAFTRTQSKGLYDAIDDTQ